MEIAAIQIDSYAGDIRKNIEKHLKFAESAVQAGADLIVFPELSITGYEPTLAAELATSPDDPTFEIIQNFVDREQTVVAIGMPCKTSSKPQIGLGIYQPHLPPLAYAKMMLDPDELPYFSAGDQPLVLPLSNQRIAFGICYETQQESHLQQLLVESPTVYVASVALPDRSIEKSHRHYAAMAKKYQLPLVLANCVGQHDIYQCGGESAGWKANGEQFGQLKADVESVLLVAIDENNVII